MYPDDSRLYIKEEYIAISTIYKDNYIECAKCIAHEMRHIFQLFYVQLFDDDRSRIWRKELTNAISSQNLEMRDYESQELELDAFAFTKYFLETFEGI